MIDKLTYSNTICSNPTFALDIKTADWPVFCVDTSIIWPVNNKCCFLVTTSLAPQNSQREVTSIFLRLSLVVVQVMGVTPMILFLCCVMLVVGIEPRNDTLDGFESSGGDYDFDYELDQQDDTDDDVDEDYVDDILQKIGEIDQT